MKLLQRTLTTAAPVVASLAVASMAVAQSGGPRQPKVDAVPSPVIGYGIFLLFAGIILAISLYPSKRAHTDLS